MPEEFLPVPAPDDVPQPEAVPSGYFKPNRPTLVFVHVGLTILTLIVLGVAVAITFAAALAVISIWFERQYVPIVRAVLGVAVAAASIYVLRLLMRRTPIQL